MVLNTAKPIHVQYTNRLSTQRGFIELNARVWWLLDYDQDKVKMNDILLRYTCDCIALWEIGDG